MASVSYNEQCFLIDGRPFWILGAQIDYCRVIPDQWAERIAAAKQAGFNTIQTTCPWMIHEQRQGRYVFSDQSDVRAFVERCGKAGMKVVLRLGPAVGAGLDGSGIPGWLIEQPDIRLREADPTFLKHYSRFLRKLLNELDGLEATKGGPILLLQSEHAWTCSNPVQSEKYHKELIRFIREAGFNLPVFNANDLWQEESDTIDTWRGWDDLLVHLRQLHTVQNYAPRLVSTFRVAEPVIWGDTSTTSKSAVTMLERMAEILAAGAQFIVSPFHAGTNFDFLGGRLAGRADGFVATSGAVDPPLGEAGQRGEKYHLAKRLVTFANNFAHVFAELNPDFHPIVLDPAQLDISRSRTSTASGHGPIATVPQRGSNGRVVFVFGAGNVKQTTLLLDDGLRMSVHLGDQTVVWFVFDVDLRGTARLDYVNLCPWAIVDRSILVLFGPEKTPVLLSINNSPFEATVPGGAKPLVVEHKGITVVICNQNQIDGTYHDDEHVYVGVEGFDLEGHPIIPAGTSKTWRIGKDAEVQEITSEKGNTKVRSGRSAKSISPSIWNVATTEVHRTGESPRYASLKGPETLSECGASTGYGWYKIALSNKTSRKRKCLLPFAADRLHLFIDGKPDRIIGVGAGAELGTFDLTLGKGEHSLVILADNLGHFEQGNDFSRPKGVYGHLYEVKALASVRPKNVQANPVDPFALRGFIAGAAQGLLSEIDQVQWSFTHSKKTSILIDITGAMCHGTFVLNDEPIAYYAGATGACFDRILIGKETNESFKRGKNILRFAPDHDQHDANKDIASKVTLYECVDSPSEGAAWSFAKWEPPVATAYKKIAKAAVKSCKGSPCWWKARFELKGESQRGIATWLDTTGLSKGQAYINGHNLGRYFTSTSTGKAVGPQKKLYIPEAWLKVDATNEVLLFDEHGFDPYKTKIVFAAEGDF